MKNILIGLIIGLIVAMWVFYFFRVSTPPATSPPVTVVPTTVPTISVSQTSDEDLIKQAFAKKYNKKVDEVNVTIGKKDATHVSGGVKFGNEMAGGWFLAFKDSISSWIIVQDGNGTISCETIKPYNFPVSMVSECVDQKGNLIKL